MMKIISLLFFFISINVTAQKKWTVAKDGTGTFKTIQAAIDALPVENKIRRL